MLAADIWMILLLLVVIAGVLYLTRRGRDALEERAARATRRLLRERHDRDSAPGDAPD
jgi:cbb3-type cytochrome oxidase subunit 3